METGFRNAIPGKDFYRLCREQEKVSLRAAFDFAKSSNISLPEWKILLELSDAAKRANEFNIARENYEKVIQIAPQEFQGHLEYAKMEEECGRLASAEKILDNALTKCALTEQSFPLLIKAMKFYEKCGDITKIKTLVTKFTKFELPTTPTLGLYLNSARPKSASPPQMDPYIVKTNWKLLLEYALVLARLSYIGEAETVFNALVEFAGFSGPVFFEAAQFFFILGETQRADDIIRLGNGSCPRFGPLWFLSIKVGFQKDKEALAAGFEVKDTEKRRIIADPNEELEFENKYGYSSESLCGGDILYVKVTQMNKQIILDRFLKNSNNATNRAMHHVSKELTWKLYLELANMLFSSEIVFVYEDEATGIEIEDFLTRLARKHIMEATAKCSKNLIWKVLLGAAKLEIEQCVRKLTLMNPNGSYQQLKPRLQQPCEAVLHILQKAKGMVPSKYSIFVDLEIHRTLDLMGSDMKAEQIIRSLLSQPDQNEWKIYVEAILYYDRHENHAKSNDLIQESLLKFPATGRLWNLAISLASLNGHAEQKLLVTKALAEVPKSGEVWCEFARLCLNPSSQYYDTNEAVKYLDFAIQFTPQYGDSFIEYAKVLTLSILENFEGQDVSAKFLVGLVEKLPQYRVLMNTCIHADPNYGPLWFFCSGSGAESSSARNTFKHATSLVVSECLKFKEFYYKREQNGLASSDQEFRCAISSFMKFLAGPKFYGTTLFGLKRFVLGIESVFY